MVSSNIQQPVFGNTIHKFVTSYFVYWKRRQISHYCNYICDNISHLKLFSNATGRSYFSYCFENKRVLVSTLKCSPLALSCTKQVGRDCVN